MISFLLSEALTETHDILVASFQLSDFYKYSWCEGLIKTIRNDWWKNSEVRYKRDPSQNHNNNQKFQNQSCIQFIEIHNNSIESHLPYCFVPFEWLRRPQYWLQFIKFDLKFVLKVLKSNKLSRDGHIFQAWPYLNSLINLKLPFLSKNMSKFFHLPSPSKPCALPFNFMLERDPKNIFYHQRDIENYKDQVLNFLLFDRHENIHTESSSL